LDVKQGAGGRLFRGRGPATANNLKYMTDKGSRFPINKTGTSYLCKLVHLELTLADWNHYDAK